MKKSICLLIILLSLVAPTAGATNYATPRQQAIADFLKLQGLDTLSVGTHTQYTYKGRPLQIRVNEWEEVEHIGLKLFDARTDQKALNVIYDFLERYLLERIAAEGTDHAIRLGFDNISFDKGSPHDALKIVGDENFYCTYNAMEKCSIKWEKNGETILAATFDLDYQLLTGCNSRQLEEFFCKKLGVFRAEESDTIDTTNFPAAQYHVEEGDFFMIDAIKNDLYYTHTDEGWQLITGEQNSYKALSNTMLSDKAKGNYEINLRVDMYGYKESAIKVDFRALQQICKEEGCTNYFGIKGKEKGEFTGTLFMVNKELGYTHMLSIKISADTLKNKKGSFEGRLFVYTPLQNVTKKFFDQNNYIKQ